MKKTQWFAAALVASALLLLLSFSPSGHASQIQAEVLQDNQPPTNPSIPKVEDGAKMPETRSRLYPVQVNGKWGYIDRSGTLIVTPQFEAAEPFAEGLGVVKRLGRYGAVQSDGTMAIQPIFSKLHSPSEGLLANEESGHWGFLSPSGKKVIETRFEQVSRSTKDWRKLYRAGNTDLSTAAATPSFHRSSPSSPNSATAAPGSAMTGTGGVYRQYRLCRDPGAVLLRRKILGRACGSGRGA